MKLNPNPNDCNGDETPGTSLNSPRPCFPTVDFVAALVGMLLCCYLCPIKTSAVEAEVIGNILYPAEILREEKKQLRFVFWCSGVLCCCLEKKSEGM